MKWFKKKKKEKDISDKGIFEQGYAAIGRLLDLFYEPFLNYCKIVQEWYYTILAEFIKFLPSIMSHPEFRIRYYLYQKKKYFGW